MAQLVRGLHRFACFPQRGMQGVPEDPLAACASLSFGHIDYLLGTAFNEFGYWIPEAGGIEAFYTRVLPGLFLFAMQNMDGLSDLLASYTKEVCGTRNEKMLSFMNDLIFHAPLFLQAKALSRTSRVFRYLLTYPVPQEGLGSCHMLETVLFFGTHSERLFGDSPLPEHLVRQIQRLWVDFARFGSFPTLPSWKTVAESPQSVMLLDEKPTFAPDPLAKRLACMEPIVAASHLGERFQSFVP